MGGLLWLGTSGQLGGLSPRKLLQASLEPPMINHPGFVTLASTFSGPQVCSAPPHHQARSLGTTVLPPARAAQMLAKQEGSYRHISLCPRTPRSLLFQPQTHRSQKSPFPLPSSYALGSLFSWGTLAAVPHPDKCGEMGSGPDKILPCQGGG